MSHVTRNDSGAVTADNTSIGVHGNKLASGIYGHAKQPVVFFLGGGQLGHHGASNATSEPLRHHR